MPFGRGEDHPNVRRRAIAQANDEARRGRKRERMADERERSRAASPLHHGSEPLARRGRLLAAEKDKLKAARANLPGVKDADLAVIAGVSADSVRRHAPRAGAGAARPETVPSTQKARGRPRKVPQAAGGKERLRALAVECPFDGRHRVAARYNAGVPVNLTISGQTASREIYGRATPAAPALKRRRLREQDPRQDNERVMDMQLGFAEGIRASLEEGFPIGSHVAWADEFEARCGPGSMSARVDGTALPAALDFEKHSIKANCLVAMCASRILKAAVYRRGTETGDVAIKVRAALPAGELLTAARVRADWRGSRGLAG